MAKEINVTQRTQRIHVSPSSGAVTIENAGPIGPGGMGATGPAGAPGPTGPPGEFSNWALLTLPVTLTADIAPTVPGPYALLYAALPTSVTALSINISGLSGGSKDSRSIVEIATGDIGSEVTILSIPCGQWLSFPFIIPISIASGARLSARLKSHIASTTANITVFASDTALAFDNVDVDNIATDPSTYNGVNHPVIDTYYELIASTTRAYSGLLFLITGSTTAQAAATTTYDLAVGPPGSEVIVGTIVVSSTTGEAISTINGTPTVLFYQAVPAGSRLAYKANVASDRRWAHVIGIPS